MAFPVFLTELMIESLSNGHNDLKSIKSKVKASLFLIISSALCTQKEKKKYYV